ncbi:MAG TPA: molybdenum cofactor guanylyltransferase [Bacilli bacterium]
MLAGVILAGGKTMRDGKLKAMMPFQGEPIIRRQIREMQTICAEMIIVTNEPKQVLPVVDRDIRIITDFIPGMGPLSGMHAALKLSKCEQVWIAAADMPFVSAAAAALMLEYKESLQLDAAIPLLQGRHVPLHAVYHKSISAAVSALLHAGETRLTELLRLIHWGEVTEDEFHMRGIATSFADEIKSETLQ